MPTPQSQLNLQEHTVAWRNGDALVRVSLSFWIEVSSSSGESLPGNSDFGIEVPVAKLENLPRLIVTQVWSNYLHVLHAPDNGDLTPCGEELFDIDVIKLR
jgi:hypothetical protein